MASNNKYLIIDALPEDYGSLKKLFYSNKTEHFGRHRKKDNLEDIFYNDHKTHRLIVPLTPARHVILGYAEITNDPHLPALTGDLWPEFINFHYCCNLPLSGTNTSFLNKFVYNLGHPEMLKQILTEVYHRNNRLRFIIVFECPDYGIYPGKDKEQYYCLDGIATVFYPICFSAITCTNTQKMHVFFRENILDPIRYRKALPEDNDDLVEIVNYDNTELKENLGEYYIAEELLINTECALVVTEIYNLTSGLIWLNDNVILSNLLENYYLQPYGNLLRFNPKEKFKERMYLANTAQKRPLEKCFTAETINNMYICAAEGSLMEYGSNYSLYSSQFEGGVKAATLASIFKRFEDINTKLKSYSYYTKTRKKPIILYFNVPDGEKTKSWDARSNAFAIQLFGLLETVDPRRVFRFLSASFSAYPQKDYCVMSLRAGQKMTPVLTEILKYFIPIAFRPNCDIDEHLFITHRCAINGDMSLFPVRPCDEEDILELYKPDVNYVSAHLKRAKSRISSIANRVSVRSIHLLDSDSYEDSIHSPYDIQTVKNILANIFEDPHSVYKCLTIRCGDSTRPIDQNKIVGFVIIRPFNLSRCLEKHFHINKRDEFQNLLKAEIVTLKLHPFFHFQSDLMFRELARQTNFYNFYFFQPTDRSYVSNDLLNNMQPMEPRRIKRLWFNYLSQESDATFRSTDNSDHVLHHNVDLLSDHFAVFKTNLKSSSQFGSKKNVIILGFNDIAKALLRLLIFNWHSLSKDIQTTHNCLPQLNVTVICSPGIVEADHEHSFRCTTCPEKEARNCWINFKNSDAFIRDIIDRLDVRTWIRFVSGKIRAIDRSKHLIIMKSNCEIFYDTLLLTCGTDFGIPDNMLRKVFQPSNYSHINNRFDKILFYHKLKILQNNVTEMSIIVYGNHLKTYEFINFLLRHDVKGKQIQLILPRSRYFLQQGLMLNIAAEDTRIADILKEMAEDLGVNIYENMKFDGLALHYNEKTIKEVTFKKNITNELTTLKCDLFVSFYEKFLPQSLLKIFQAAKLDTEKEFVLVDENYETSAAGIFAMGNFIKHRIEPNHQYKFVSPQEAAEKLLQKVGLLDIEEFEEKFAKSCLFQTQLPMDFFLVKVITPKRYLANHLDNEYGFPLVTYHEGEFSRIRLNERGMVEEILVVTKNKKDYDFLKFFCGRHELLLNNLKSRWYLKEIVNFIDFLQEPWTELLMHDEFENLKKHNKDLVMGTAQEFIKIDMDHDDRRKMFYGHCQDLGITAEIEFNFLEFIRNHREDFSTDIALPEDFDRPFSKKFY